MTTNQQKEIAHLQSLPENYGWIVFGEDRFAEMKFYTIAGDEYKGSKNSWCKAPPFKGFWTMRVYRRRIDPGEGFEIVGLDDKIVGDQFEFTRDGKKWKRPDIAEGSYCARTVIAAFPELKIIAIRRRKVCGTCGGTTKVRILDDESPELASIIKDCPDCQKKPVKDALLESSSE